MTLLIIQIQMITATAILVCDNYFVIVALINCVYLHRNEGEATEALASGAEGTRTGQEGNFGFSKMFIIMKKSEKLHSDSQR